MVFRLTAPTSVVRGRRGGGLTAVAVSLVERFGLALPAAALRSSAAVFRGPTLSLREPPATKNAGPPEGVKPAHSADGDSSPSSWWGRQFTPARTARTYC